MKLSRTRNKELVKDLHSRLFPGDEITIDKKRVSWILETKDKILGFCMLKKINDDIVMLYRAGVFKANSGKGLQIRMIRCRERYARKHGYKSIISYTKIHNIKSSDNLQKCGYKMYKPEYEYADDDCIYWIKKI